MTVQNEKEKPLEYWISRATDPYLDDEARRANIDIMCDKVNIDVDGALIATGILGHKIVSPDQDEALYSLQAVDQLVRRCGEKVHTKIGKFRFLNQIVKLITPKYLGTQTSSEVKQLSIKLLYSWQRSMRHVEKFKEVYDSLKEHHLILADPIIPEEEIMIVPASTPKLAIFEDEEKSRLLKELLNSNNPNDLQAANRLIQSLVKTEDQKIEKMNKRSDDLDHARRLCQTLETFMMEKTAEALGLAINVTDIDRKLKVLSEELLSMRPSLFRYAGEAAENEDSILADILAVNDQVNRLIQKYRTNQESMINQVNNGGSEEETADLLGADLTDSTSTSEQPHSSKTTSIFEADDIFETNQKDALVNDFPDVPFIGFDRLLTPALPRRSNMKNTANPQPKLSPLSTLMDDDLFSNAPNHPQSFKSLKPTLNDLCSSLSTTNISDDFSTSILPESISLNSSTVQLASNPPSAVLEKQNINILLYCSTLSHITGMKTYILAIFNTHVETCHNIRLMMGTTNKKVSVHLQNGGNFDLLGVTPCRPIATVYRILCILPLSDVKEVDLDFSISYTQNYDRSITGNIILTLD